MVPDLPSFDGDSYVVPVASLPVKEKLPENIDQLILLATRDAFALYGAASTTDDERAYLVTDTKRILELDPETDTTRKQVQRAFDTFRDEHDTERREVESMELAWCLILQASKHLHDRLVSEYCFNDCAKPKVRRRQKKAS
jgi:hypothetical protein